MRTAYRSCFGALVLLGGALSCCAATWYRNPDTNMGTSNSGGWLTNRQYWRNGDVDGPVGSGSFTAADDVVFTGAAASGKYERRLRLPGRAYLCNTLQIGAADSQNEVVHDGGNFNLGAGGLRLANGNWFCNAGLDMSILCPVDILSSDTAPFQIHYGQEQYSNRTVTVSGALSGAAGTGLACGYLNGRSRTAARNATYSFANINGFSGTLFVQGPSKYPTNGKVFGSRLSIPCETVSDCRIEVQAGGVLKVSGVSGLAQIGSVAFADGVRLELSGVGSGVTCTGLKVTDAYSQAGVVEVAIVDFALRPLNGSRVLILEAPEDVSLDVDQFQLLLLGAGSSSAVTLAAEGNRLYAVSDGSAAGGVWVLNQDITDWNVKALEKMQYWNDADGNPGATDAEPTADGDFFIYGAGNATSTPVYKRRLRVGVTTFNGNSLHLGDATTFGEVVQDRTPVTLANQGLFLYNGWWWFNNGGVQVVDGDVTVQVNTTGYLPSLLFAQYSHCGSTGRIAGKLKGSSEATLRLGYHEAVNGNVTNSYYELCDCSEFHGRLYVVKNLNPSTVFKDRAFGSCVRFKAGDVSDCTVELTDKCYASTIDTSGTATIGTLKIAPGAGIMLRGDANGIGHLKVQTALVPPSSGKIAVYCPNFTVYNQTKLPLFTWPAATSLTAGDFLLDPDPALVNAFTLSVEEDVVNGSTVSYTLYANMGNPLVRQIANYPHSNYRDNIVASSFTNAAHWGDGQVPHAGADYITVYDVCTPYVARNDPSWDYAFPGDSLLLNGGRLWLYTATFEVPRLICRGEAYVNMTMQTIPTVSRVIAPCGIEVADVLSLRAHQSRTLVLEGPISGTGNIRIPGFSGTGNPAGKFELRGDNSGFTGTISLEQAELRPAYHNFAQLFLTLYVNDGANLGGELDTFNPRALKVTELARLSVTNTASPVVLADGLNRGVYLYAGGRFHTEANACLDVEWPLLLNGPMWKEGAGTLVLGKELSYEQAGGAIAATPLAGSNVFTVAAGTVKVRHAEAMRLLETSFAAGTSLVVEHFDGEDEALATYGLKALADTPFALAAELDGCLPISTQFADMPEPTARETLLPLVTVKNANVESMRTMLRNVARTWANLPQRIITRANDDGETTTFIVQCRHQGTLMILR